MRSGGKPGWIYVLDCRVTINDKPVVKIGYTTQAVEKRAKQLSTGAAGGMKILYREWVSDARSVEARVHATFRGDRVNGEFFATPVSDVIAEIQRVAPTASMKAADLEWSRGMKEFCNQIGVTAAEEAVRKAAMRTLVVAITIWIGLCGWFIYHGSGLAIGLLFPGIIPVAIVIHSQVEKRLRAEWIDRPFGIQIEHERERLNMLFPTSWSSTWSNKTKALASGSLGSDERHG